MARITISGPCLASLLHSAFANQGPCDGLLYGTTATHVSSTTHDTQENLQQVHEELWVLDYITDLTPLSFYDNTGDVADDKVRDFSSNSSHTLLGWFSFFPYSTASPSLREQAVHASLARTLSQGLSKPEPHLPIFLKLSTSSTHNGATLGASCKCYISRGPQRALEAVDLHIPNLNTRGGGQEYSSFAHLPSFPWDRAVGGSGQVFDHSLQAAMDASTAGVSALQATYTDMLQRMQELSSVIGREQGEVDKLERERDALLALLAG